MTKAVTIFLVFIFAIAATVSLILYKSEIDKNSIMRQEHLKSIQDAEAQLKKIKDEYKNKSEDGLEDKQKLLEQLTQFSKERDKAVGELKEIKSGILREREISLVASEDLQILRQEVARIKKDGSEGIKKLDEAFKRKRQTYEARILSLEAQLDKLKNRLNVDLERYHYNLGVVYSQNKEYDIAVKEFKASLGYNPDNPQTHYNLGIIYDDYFKDKENARKHYNTFLRLSPTSDDAESVNEWLSNLDKSI